MASITWDMRDFLDGLEKLDKLVVTSSMRANRNCAEDLLTLSQEVVPHNIGTLQTSGYVRHLNELSVVGYGGMASDYALYQHEAKGLTYSKAGRTNKYLERPMKQNLKKWHRIYGDVVKASF